jgi:hypothetical protein
MTQAVWTLQMPLTQVMAYPCSRAFVQTANAQTQGHTVKVKHRANNKGSNEHDETQLKLQSVDFHPELRRLGG